MLLDEIGSYLASGGVGTLGTDLFLGQLPDSPDAAVVVFETGGMGSVHTMSTGPGNAIAERPRVQVVARAATYSAARTKAHDVFLLLDGLRARTLGSTRYLWGQGVQSPFLLERDQANRTKIACNYELVKALSTA